MEQPFVTVSVLSYNSSRTIKETLDSIFYQSYPNLELIISDDCSTDKTLGICKEWINKHKNRFRRTQILTVEHNTGVSANINRAWSACKTEWNKDIAGDDILFPNCIEDYVSFIDKNPDAIVIFSRLRRFRTWLGIKQWLPDTWHNYGFFELSYEEQQHYLVYNTGHIPTCTAFYNLPEVFKRNYRHDERIPLLEDDPKWIVFARTGIKFRFLDKETVGYRCSHRSLANGIHSPRYFNSRLLFYLYYYLDEINHGEDRDSIYNLICHEALNSYWAPYSISQSVDYKVGKILLFPFHIIKKVLNRLFRFLKGRLQ